MLQDERSGLVPAQVQEEVRKFQVLVPAAGVEPSREMAGCFSRTFVLARIKGYSFALTSNASPSRFPPNPKEAVD